MNKKLLSIPVVLLFAFMLKGCYTSGTLAEEKNNDTVVYYPETTVIVIGCPVVDPPPPTPIVKYRKPAHSSHNSHGSRLRNSNGMSNRGKSNRNSGINRRNNRRKE